MTFLLLTAFIVALVSIPETQASVVVAEKSGKLGVIKGVVRDGAGKPIAEATVAVFRVGTTKLLKQVRSAADGSFMAKLLPGTYSILAVAEGFNPVSLSKVEVNRSSELVYRFNLEPSGRGNTLPEKKAERKSSKYPIRRAIIGRSIYQAKDGEVPIDEMKTDDQAVAGTEVESSLEVQAKREEEESGRPSQTVVETYFAASDQDSFAGLNFATLLPVTDKAEVVLAGQTGSGENAPQRFEANLNVRPDQNHQLRFKGAIADLGKIKTGEEKDAAGQKEVSLGQFSFQALDEWKVSEGIVLVYGFDYSRFIGAGDDFSISPRLGFQLDINSKTRLRAAYTTANEERTWKRAIELENTQVLFREPVAMQDIVVENDKPQINKSRRLEFGIERVLDNKSTVEANVFFDAVNGRGVGLINLPFDSLSGDGLQEFVANQQGKAQGLRVVYTRRLNGTFSTSAGYAFGNGQKLSTDGLTNPVNLFENDLFQTFVGQLDADLGTGTNVKTIFRLSPQATVFAIDPFAGRMAIYDPSLSVLVTQSLPSWGLPIHAEAMIDARNLFDFQSGVTGEEGTLRINSQRRILRGGISVRF
ncbi:MAG: carboxypeptidase regulatory-like domain-containing protein [Pyrinomonadaceae bacterium]